MNPSRTNADRSSAAADPANPWRDRVAATDWETVRDGLDRVVVR